MKNSKGNYFTVWYCTKRESSMYCGDNYKFVSIDDAKRIEIKDFMNHQAWWISTRPNGWLEIKNPSLLTVFSTRTELIQLGLFK